ncbi:hypothetical protein UlMin_012222 [Ulmus minor]
MTSAEVLSFTIILLLPFCVSLDTITPDTPLKDGDVLISDTKNFALGFFPAGNSSCRYVGIWYYQITEQTVVWVANRDNCINNTSGVLAININQGGLVIYANNQTNTPLWSSNVSSLLTSNSIAKLLDIGNLVLLESNITQKLLWQSFDHPTNVMIPFLKQGLNRRTGSEWALTSWKSKDDPGTGDCWYGIDPTGYPQVIVNKSQATWWRGGPWTGRGWSGVPEMSNNFIFNVSFVNNQDELSIAFGSVNDSIYSILSVDESSMVQRSIWHDEDRRWVNFWSAPSEWCDYYGQCGPNGNCDPTKDKIFACECFPGFEPKSPGNWYLRDGSGGCVRKQGVGTCGNGEGFVKMERMKVADTRNARANMSLSLQECEQLCLKNCSCMAYAYATSDMNREGIGCLTWYEDLVDSRTFSSSSSGQDLYIRVDAITLAEYAKKSNKYLSKKGKLGISLSSVIMFFLILFLAFHIVKKRRKAKERQRTLYNVTYREDFRGTIELEENRTNPDQLPFFHLNVIVEATKNFSLNNKLGEGGFGIVYKGMLFDGSEIAVKRLSKHSGQGIEEFKNEVMLIAKLQHRNLVKILGYCAQGEEKMIIYEYLPNKSLDSIIFDETKRRLLDWRKRKDIICGIARGMLYLHQDSRLRIIHRDLKAGNILLDACMNPKVADFGMARIFGVDQIEAKTKRLVGTYGYMSPEYAMEGRFSVKSDVYSFGVLMLEIITSKKNSYYKLNPYSNLIGSVWDLWKEGRALEIVESPLNGSFAGEALRCIEIGLLCVQEYASDRPTMSEVVSMLGNDVALSPPTRPALRFKRAYTSGDPSSASEGANSVNNVTCTVVEPR